MKSILVVAALGVAGALGPADSNVSRAEAREVARIQSHFDSVLVELASRDVSRLDATQGSNRSSIVATLRGYRARGVFPHNYDFTAPTPYFIDRKTGTLCAVAFLMESSGQRGMVNRIAVTDNNVWVAELAGDREVESWLSQNGLTLEEAARIQIPYIGGPPAPVSPKVDANFGRKHNSMAFGNALLSSATTAVNLHRGKPSIWRVGLSVGLGVAASRLSFPYLGDSRMNRNMQYLNVAAGTASVITGLYPLLPRPTLDAEPAAASKVTFAPTVDVLKKTSGLSMSLRF